VQAMMSKAQWEEQQAKEADWGKRNDVACGVAANPTVKRTAISLADEILRLGMTLDFTWESHEKIVAALEQQDRLPGLAHALMECLGECALQLNRIQLTVADTKRDFGV
jgi:hypothetical protein